MGCSQSKTSVDPSSPLSLEHVEVMRCLGMGAFGEVNAIRFRFPPSEYRGGRERSDTALSAFSASMQNENKEMFALKKISKEKLEARKTHLAGTLLEKELLEDMWKRSEEPTPFVCQLYGSFQDESFLYLILDLMLGGSLKFHQKQGNFALHDERMLRFLVCEISTGLSCIHNMGIIHRDIKPDNIIMDGDGHVYLTDFNLSFRFTDKEVEECPQPAVDLKVPPGGPVVGTKGFIAPEMLLGKEYGPQVDYWSLGVMLYSLFFGATPWAMEKLQREAERQAIAFEEMNIDRDLEDSFTIAAIASNQKANAASFSDSNGNLLGKKHVRAVLHGEIPIPTQILQPDTANATTEGVDSRSSINIVARRPTSHNKVGHKSSSSFGMKKLPTKEAIDLILGLLDRNTETRLNSITVTKQPLLRRINWNKVAVKGLRPPLKPSLKTVNVDKSHEIFQALVTDQGPAKVGQSTIPPRVQIQHYWSWHFNKFRGSIEPDPYIDQVEDWLHAHQTDSAEMTDEDSSRYTAMRSNTSARERVQMFQSQLTDTLGEVSFLSLNASNRLLAEVEEQ